MQKVLVPVPTLYLQDRNHAARITSCHNCKVQMLLHLTSYRIASLHLPQTAASVPLQDKKALEDRLKEVQNILETVQNQRNELRQQYKEEKTARETLESQLAAARQQGDYDINAAKENAAQTVGQLVSLQLLLFC